MLQDPKTALWHSTSRQSIKAVYLRRLGCLFENYHTDQEEFVEMAPTQRRDGLQRAINDM